jgi:hypothetical protein
MHYQTFFVEVPVRVPLIAGHPLSSCLTDPELMEKFAGTKLSNEEFSTSRLRDLIRMVVA